MRYIHTAESRPSEADSRSVSQEIPSILRNPKVHYRIYMSPPLVPVLSQLIPVHIPYSFNINFNIYPCLPSGLFLSRFLTQDVRIFRLPHKFSVPQIPHLLLADCPNKIY